MQQFDAMPQTFQDKRYNCFVTDSADLIYKAQRLRHRVFVGELDANFEHARIPLYRDEFDAYGEHLIVFDYYELKVIGYARLFDPERAEKVGCFYSQTKFDMDALFKLEGRLLEVGHICVDPAYRSNAVLSELCNGLSRYALEGGYQYLFGCAGIAPGADGFCVETLRRGIAAKHLAPPGINAEPLIPVPEQMHCKCETCGTPSLPPLLKIWLQLGAWMCGEPCWNAERNVMNVPLLLPLRQIKPGYRSHYLQQVM